MSYCRWSDSDIYAYDGGIVGYCIAVSGNNGLAEDGKFFTFEQLEWFRAKLLELRGMGYYVPDYAIAQIDEEMREEAEIA